MALPVFNRETTKLETSEAPRGAVSGDIKPKKTTGLPVFTRPDQPAVTQNLPAGIPPAIKPEKYTYEKLGSDMLNLAATPVQGFLSSAGNLLGQAVDTLSFGLKAPSKNRQLLGNVFTQAGIPDDKNPYKKEPVLEKALGYSIFDKLAEKTEKVSGTIKDTNEKFTKKAIETNPLSDTFAGKTGSIIGGMAPQVLLSAIRTPSLLLSLSESGMNVQDSYEANIAKGMSEKEALRVAVPQLGADLFGTYLSNKIGGLGTIEKALDGKAKKGIIGGIFNYLKDTSLEVGQEVYQKFLQNIAEDKPVTEGLSETAKLTVIPALLFGMAGPVLNFSQDKIDSATPEQKAQIIEDVKEKIKENPELMADPEISEFVNPLVNIPKAPTVEEAKAASEAKVASETLNAEKDTNTGLLEFIENTTLEPITVEESTPRGTSKIAKSVNQKSIEASLTKGFSELAGYGKITIKDQSERASSFIESNLEDAKKVLTGELDLPKGLKGTALIKGFEDYLKKNSDTELAYKLANSPLITGTSEAAQELRLAAERDPDSATSKIQEIKKTREEKLNKPKRDRIKKDVQKIKEASKEINLTKEDLAWDSFLDSITC